MAYDITLIGCGKMGGAMMRSWLANDLVQHIKIIDPTSLNDMLMSDSRISYSPKYDDSKITSDILILAVKPQILKDASGEITNNLSDNTALLSIAAGQSIATLENIFGSDKAIIRTMPNTPASIGKGVSVSIANKNVTDSQKNVAQKLLNASGESLWVDNEALIDSVTALSGSGPAYIFYLIEALAKAGETTGLSSDISMKLARQTIIGSAALAEYEADTSAATLRENVTSPNGTTQAALDVLMDGRFQSILDETLSAAKNRAKELNQ